MDARYILVHLKRDGARQIHNIRSLNQTSGTWPTLTLWRTRTLNNIECSRRLTHVAEACTDNIVRILVLLKAASFLRFIEERVLLLYCCQLHYNQSIIITVHNQSAFQ